MAARRLCGDRGDRRVRQWEKDPEDGAAEFGLGLDGVFGEAQGWYATPLHPELREIALGSYRTRKPPEIRGSGKVTHALEAALWAFSRSDDFRTGCLTAVNLGEDADTTGAIYGQLAGAYYGESGIPAGWRDVPRRSRLVTGRRYAPAKRSCVAFTARASASTSCSVL